VSGLCLFFWGEVVMSQGSSTVSLAVVSLGVGIDTARSCPSEIVFEPRSGEGIWEKKPRR
ncbi:MAG TPA: hypothetical protein VK137_04835, partial [Planctomycetaceae bacterium]|nr:hypothetical protein [Planctomycetaceae bacterium]